MPGARCRQLLAGCRSRATQQLRMSNVYKLQLISDKWYYSRKGHIMSLHKLAKLTGYIFVLIGVLGFIPGVTDNNMLLGLFHVNGPHNWFHIISGLVAFRVSRADQKITKLFFQVLGLVYLATALMGFRNVDEPLFGLIANNSADNWLHLGLSIAFLYIGFLYSSHRVK